MDARLRSPLERLGGRDSGEGRALDLPHGTEVVTRVERVMGERRVARGAIGRVMKTHEDALDVAIVGVGTIRYGKDEVDARRVGQAAFARRRQLAWDALSPTIVVEAVVGSRAWGLAHAGSDEDRRGVFALPFAWTSGIVAPPEDLVSADGSSTYWSVGKCVLQALRADPNTLETLFVESVTARDPIGQMVIDARDAFVSKEIYGTFGRYAMAQLRRERFTGCLEVSAKDGPRRRLWWSEGQVVGGASASAGESVLGRLSARGLIDAGHLELAGRWSSGDPRRDVERLAQAGWIKPQEAQEALREPVRRIVERVAERESLAWSLHPGERAPVAIELGVPLAALIAGGVRGGRTREQLRAAVPDEVRPRLSFAGPEALAAELRWPEAAAIAGRFDGQARVDELIAAAIADEEELRGLVHVLGLLGHLAPPVEDVAASLVALDRRRVRERLRLARETDYFALLGLPRDATRAEVLRAHADLTATFREALEPASRVELAEELAELYAALDEARDVLTDEALHSAYLAQLGEP